VVGAGADHDRVEAPGVVYGRHTNGKATCLKKPSGT
jgi:hypothetical protein